jgi:uncharacterized RDD family membrane protein YckC
MHLDCPHCGSALEFADKRPLFCAYCGQSLTATPAPALDSEAVTVTAPAPGPTPDESAPSTVGGYRLLRPLGSGGMGTVFEAEETTSGRRVALKLVSAGGDATPEALERFRQEGRLASGIAHPRCVFVLAADEEAGRPYIVMELMPGRTLEDLVSERGPLPPDEAVAKILDVIDGLREAHKLGVIHRDVKPSNCFLDADGRVKVGDFGLAKSLGRQAHLTKTGSFLGTPLYASPEQIRADRLDPLTDLYSVAATLYFLLTGRAPHQTGDAVATLAAIVADPAPPLRRWRPELSAALERVVLRALERDRQRRYRDLDEFRRALLPFAPGRLSIGGMGVRLGAWAVDYLTMMLLFVLPVSLLVLGSGASHMFDPRMALVSVRYQWLGVVAWALYFSVQEGVWGCSLGKRLLGLRVQTAGGDPPGVLRAVLRALVFESSFALSFPAALTIVLVYVPPEAPMNDVIFYANVINALNGLGAVVGIGLMLSPMRARNGYRGLHEFASGTRVVLLPQVPKRRTFAPRPPDEDLRRTEGLPERLGPFTVRGKLPGTGERILVGHDAALGRTAWIWIRSPDEPALPAARRELARAGRSRWLAGGEQSGFRWDAFLATAGASLPDIRAGAGSLPWPDARPLLEQLTDELAAACGDATLPARLGVEQVWIQPNGDLQLLDFSLGGAAAEGDPAPAGEAEQQRALGLIRRAVTCLLDGGPGAAATGEAPRARVPEHARLFLERLFARRGGYREVKRFQAALQATSEQPVEVSRLRRAAQLALWLVFTFMGPCSCLFLTALAPMLSSYILAVRIMEREYERRELEEVATQEFAAAVFHPQPLVRANAALQLQQDLALRDQLDQSILAYRQQHELRLASSSRFGGRRLVSVLENTLEQQFPTMRERRYSEQGGIQPARFRENARRSAERPPSDGDGLFTVTTVLLLIWPVVWVAWAFQWRGGLTYRLTGIALVRADGRPAARWQCAWRQLLVWAPVIGLFVLSTWAETSYWSRWSEPGAAWLPWFSWAVWWLAMALLAGFVGLALWRPARSLHDRLAGVYLVPR